MWHANTYSDCDPFAHAHPNCDANSESHNNPYSYTE